MKKIALALVIGSSFLLFSCNDSKPAENVNEVVEETISEEKITEIEETTEAITEGTEQLGTDIDSLENEIDNLLNEI